MSDAFLHDVTITADLAGEGNDSTSFEILSGEAGDFVCLASCKIKNSAALRSIIIAFGGEFIGSNGHESFFMVRINGATNVMEAANTVLAAIPEQYNTDSVLYTYWIRPDLEIIFFDYPYEPTKLKLLCDTPPLALPSHLAEAISRTNLCTDVEIDSQPVAIGFIEAQLTATDSKLTVFQQIADIALDIR